MTTLELKKQLIHRIAEINDVSFLKAIQTILDSKKESDILLLSDQQKTEINEAKAEIMQGKYSTHYALDKEFSLRIIV